MAGRLSAPVGVFGDVYITEFGVNNASYGMSVERVKADVRRPARMRSAILATPTPIDLSRAHARPETVDSTAYPQPVREVAAETGVPFADMHAYVLSLPN